MEEDEDLKKIKTMLRSVLISSKEGIPAVKLQEEYKEFVGDFLPYKKLGFNSLEEFIAAVPDVVFVSRNRQGEVIFKAMADSTTAHIQKLVSKQRSKKKLKKPVRRPAPRANYALKLNRPPTAPIANRGWGMPPPWVKQQPRQPLLPTPHARLVSSHPARRPENIVVVAPKNNSQSRFVRFGQNRLLEQAISQAGSDRPGGEWKYGAGYEVPPRFRRKPSRSQESAKPKITLPKVEDGAECLTSLSHYCRLNDLEMTFATVNAKNGYVSSIKLRGVTYGSEGVYETATDAEQAAAKNAVTKIQINDDYVIDDWEEPWADDHEDSKESSLPSEQLSHIKARVKQILMSRKAGLWGTRLPHEYKEMFDEDPPPDLLQMVRNWKDIAKVEFAFNTDRDIIYPVVEDPNKNKDLVIPQIDLLPEESDTGETVYLTYIYSPAYFCVQREDSCVDNINEALDQLCKDKVVPDVEFLQKGRYCAGIYSGDGNWTRAEILEIKSNGESLELLFVDYGNVETVDVKSVHWLSEKTAKEPVQASNCSLYGIQPLEGEADWSKKASKVFAAEVQDKALVAIPHGKYDNMFDIELFLKSDPSVSINQKLVQMGVVRSLQLEKEDEVTEEVTEECCDPDLITLPEDKLWDVHITYIADSTNAVVLRLVGEEYSDRLDQYQLKLQEAFRNSDSDAPIVEGAIYVAYDDDLYHRVIVQEVTGPTVRCYFLDHGDTDDLTPDQLEPLDPQINKLLPYQAIEVSLYGLEEVATNVTTLEKFCDLTLDKTCVAEVAARDKCLSVVLYDTNGEEDININEAILMAIKSDGGGIDSPRSASPDIRTSPKHSPYSSEGKLSPLVESGSQSSLSRVAYTSSGSLNSDRVSQLTMPKDVGVENTTQNESKPGPYLTSQTPNVVRVDNSGIIPEKSPEVPEQSGVSQYSVSWSTGSTENIQTDVSFQQNVSNLLPTFTNNMTSLTTPEEVTGTLPSAVLGSPQDEQNLEHMSEKLFNLSVSGKGNSGVLPQSSVYSDSWSVWNPVEYAKREIPPPFPIPEVGEFLDIHTYFIHSPSNFVCIPYENMNHLDQMMKDMIQHFTPRPTTVMKLSDIKLGHLYAGFKDGCWYRAKVCQLFPDSDVQLSVNLVDFGDFSVMKLDDILPLPWRFWKLPQQGIRAKLGSVKPKDGDWSEAAKFKFIEMAYDKDLVGLVQGRDPQTGVVSFRLIDTSSDFVDVCLDEVLIQRNLALMTE